MPPVVVVGGGLAGIAAAVRLIDAGRSVVLLETRKKLGGRATSFIDPRNAEVLDNCQHVLMGSCTNLIDLYERLGVLANIEWHRQIWWANPPHEHDVMRPGRLPAPAHFTISFLRLRFLERDDKRSIARAMWQLIRIGREGRQAWRGKSFAAFLDHTQQTKRARELFWEPIVTSACNVPCARTDAFHAMYVFQGGFLQDSWSPVMGLSAVPLWSLYDSAHRILKDAGGSLRTGVSAIALAFDGRRITGVVTNEGIVEASAVVAAVPPDRLAKLCSQVVRSADQRLARLEEFEFSPILGAHLFFAQPVLTTPHLVLPGRATHWLFDKGRDAQGRFHVHAVVSAADDWMALDESEITARLMRDIHWALPHTAGLQPEAVRTVKEKRATFACLPGSDALRPAACADGVRGGINNLFLAGDWCATDWPATMEGAVRSGYLAAQGVIAGRGLIADVPVAPLARLLGL
ncbi:MAG: FAD-dependent oxidoreductase [Phycisphaerales bacterium]|nr:FAD-dependent oxidoreductase [Phycisphaerales bacterium]